MHSRPDLNARGKPDTIGHQMAIDWTAEQRRRVDRALTAYGVASARCERAAHKILPVAREQDGAAKGRRCVPCFGLYVCPTRRWYFHVNVHVSGHYVDALTGAPGTNEEAYLQTHWPDSDAIAWEDLTDDRLQELAR